MGSNRVILDHDVIFMGKVEDSGCLQPPTSIFCFGVVEGCGHEVNQSPKKSPTFNLVSTISFSSALTELNVCWFRFLLGVPYTICVST